MPAYITFNDIAVFNGGIVLQFGVQISGTQKTIWTPLYTKKGNLKAHLYF